MALELRTACERCGVALAPDGEARICSYEIEDYNTAVRDLMAAVAGALGREAMGRSLACGPRATIEPSIRTGVLVYERASA
jgi:hypothetical protein